MEGSVLSAFSLSEETMKKLEKHFSSIMHERVKLTLHIDQSLIGGIIVTIGDWIFDGSIKNQLNRLEEYILRD